jgi:ABC-type dipeptide/oligopeptide/nickel transport system permease subunit
LNGRKLGYLTLVLMIGLLLGSAVGDILGYFLPDSPVKRVFVLGFTYVFPPATLNLIILSITFGFSVKANVVSVLFVLLLAHLLKWFNIVR